MDSVETMRRNHVTDVAGTELMMATKLDHYANGDCRMLPFLDSDARTVDNLLYPLREEERLAFADGCKVARQELDKLATAVANDQKIFDFTAFDIHPKHRPEFQGLLGELNSFITFTDNHLYRVMSDA